MEPDDIKKARTHLETMSAMPSGQRADYLTRIYKKEPGVGREVENMMKADGQQADWTQPPARQAESSILQPGDQIGSYEIIELIGEGGMGFIYRAEDRKLQRHVALKFLPAEQNRDEQYRQRFLLEARAASRLDHPNICVIHDVNETPDGRLYITMPCYEGETLSRRISRGPLPDTDALDIAIAVADGLAHAHGHDIVHRDIKPGNIMLTRDGGVKVLDFGIAKVRNNDLTSTGVSIGTLAYMSPEQLRGEGVDAGTDIWALGAVLFEMLLARKAFPSSVLPEVVDVVLHQEYSELESVELPEHLLQLLRDALARDRQQRFVSMAEMRDALLQVRGKDGSSQSDQPLSFAQPRKGRGYQWDENLLLQIAEFITPMLGPISSILVRRRAAEAEDAEQLKQLLAASITDADCRAEFNRLFDSKMADLTSPPVPRRLRTDGSYAGVELTPVQLTEMETALIDNLGPITQVLVKRNARRATSMHELIDLLSVHIEDENDRQAFVKTMCNKYPPRDPL